MVWNAGSHSLMEDRFGWQSQIILEPTSGWITLEKLKSSFPEGEVTVFFSVAFLDSPWKCLPSTTAALLGGTAGTLYSNTPTPTPRLADTVGL